MKACSKNKVLAAICNRHGINLYHHQLDGASWQICAGGYVVNGYSDGRSRSELLRAMNTTLVLLLKYGLRPWHIYGYEHNVTWRKESHAIIPVAEPLHSNGVEIHTSRDKEYDEWYQKYLDLKNS